MTSSTTQGERIEGFTFKGPGRSKYPWNEWTDGATWRIRQNSDYTISTANMQISLHMRARSKSLSVQTEKFTDHDGEGLVFQFTPNEETSHE